MTLNANQSTFDFCYNYSLPGASWAGCFSDDSVVRQANGLPAGRTLAQTLDLHTDAEAVLFNLGGNDESMTPDAITLLTSRIKAAANLCIARGKMFAFVGIVDVNTTSTCNYQPLGTNLYDSGYLPLAARIAASAEILRQTCIHEGYAFVDTRNLNKITNWGTITGDLVHPSQSYSTQIFTTVAKAITGQ